MAEEKFYTKEAVVTAVKLAVRGMAGLIDCDEAKKMVDSLPESLSELVMGESIKAKRERDRMKVEAFRTAFNIITQLENGPEKN